MRNLNRGNVFNAGRQTGHRNFQPVSIAESVLRELKRFRSIHHVATTNSWWLSVLLTLVREHQNVNRIRNELLKASFGSQSVMVVIPQSQRRPARFCRISETADFDTAARDSRLLM